MWRSIFLLIEERVGEFPDLVDEIKRNGRFGHSRRDRDVIPEAR